MIQHLHEFAVDIGISTVFAGLCGALAYGVKREEGKPFKWSEFLWLCTDCLWFVKRNIGMDGNKAIASY